MHDLHCHTSLSACAKRESTLSVMLGALKSGGVSVAGIANHLWDRSEERRVGKEC